MEAGKLRHRVTIQAATETVDEFGSRTSNFADVKTVWAEVRPLEGRELWRAAQVQAEVTHSVTMRYGGPIQAKMQIIHRGRILAILSVVNRDEKRETLIVMAKEVTP